MNVDQSSQGTVVAFEAEAALIKGQVVTFGTSPNQVNIGSASDVCAGLCLESAPAGANVDVLMHGIGRGIASAAISQGALVAIEAGGQLVAITLGTSTADQRVVGKALSAASAAGDELSVFVGLNDGVLV